MFVAFFADCCRFLKHWRRYQNFIIVRTIRFVEISPACGLNTYQIVSGETFDFQYQHHQRWPKIPVWKINFSVNLSFALFPAALCWRLKSQVFLYIPYKMFVSLASEIWTKPYNPNSMTFLTAWQKKEKKNTGFFKTIYARTLTLLWRTFM